MGKRSRRRKRETSVVRLNRKARREALAAARQMSAQIRADIVDLSVPAENVAGDLLRLFAENHPRFEFAASMAGLSSTERLEAIAQAAIAIEPDSVTSRVLAAVAANLRDDVASEIEHLRHACSISADDDVVENLMFALLEIGRVAEVLEEIVFQNLKEPLETKWTEMYGKALQVAWERSLVTRPKEPCPCDSGKQYRRCCREAETLHVDRFIDREPVYRVKQALQSVYDEPQMAPFLKSAAHGWAKVGLDDPHHDEGNAKLFYDWAATIPDISTDDDFDETMLTILSRDDRFDEDIRRWAKGWDDVRMYGLWQVKDPEPSPGVHLGDILTGRSHYVSCADEQMEGIRPWTILMGPLHPIDGVWHMGSAMMPLAPWEAETLGRDVLSATDRMIAKMGSRSKARLESLADLPLGVVLAAAPVPPEVSNLISGALEALFPIFLAGVMEERSRPMIVNNTDGDPLLLIEATLEIDDPNQLINQLNGLPDFEWDPDEREFHWYGREMTDSEIEVTDAQVEAFAIEKGGTIGGDVGPHRWSRGWLRIDGSKVKVSVNSQGRFDRLLAILGDAGLAPRVVEISKIDPALDLPVPSESVHNDDNKAAMSNEALRAWERTWVDEEIPALGGLTPREAVEDSEGRVRLEALLRDFEYREAASPERIGSAARLRQMLEI